MKINKIILLGLSTLLALNFSFAAEKWPWPTCRNDMNQMNEQFKKYPLGPLIAQNALVNRIGKYPHRISSTQCALKCHTDILGDGICTWDRGNWGKTLRYKQN